MKKSINLIVSLLSLLYIYSINEFKMRSLGDGYYIISRPYEKPFRFHSRFLETVNKFIQGGEVSYEWSEEKQKYINWNYEFLFELDDYFV